MAKPFIKISYNGKGKNATSVIPSLEYITRNDPIYQNRKDLVAMTLVNLPELYKKKEREDIENIIDYYKDFELYSRKGRKTNMNLIFDLPLTKDKKNFETVDEGINSRIVNGFIEELHRRYVLVEENGKKKVYKKEIAEELVNQNSNLKIENIKMPIFYAIHKLEKSSQREHPHCHMIISTLCFNEEQINTKNMSKEMLMRSGYDNRQLSKVAFYYNVYQILTDVVNKELSQLPEEKRKHIDKYFINLKNRNILKNEKSEIEHVALAFKKIDSPELTYRENLQLNRNFDKLDREYKEIEHLLKQIASQKKKVINLFQARESDTSLMEIIIKRNRAYERLLSLMPEDAMSIKTYFQKGTVGKNIDFNSYKIIKHLQEGIETDDIPAKKIFVDKPEIVPYYFNRGSMKDYINVLKQKKEIFEEEENFEDMEKTLDKFSGEYYDAVKKYNNITPYELKEFENAFRNRDINTPDAIEVKYDILKYEKAKEKLVERIATYDFQIFSSLESRNATNLIKQYYLSGNFGEDVLEIRLEDYIEENSEVTYTISGKEITTRLSEAKANLETILNHLNVQRNRAKEESDNIIREEIRKNIETLIKYKQSIEDGIMNFEKYALLKLTENFNKKLSEKSLNLSPARKKLYAKEIDAYKKSITDTKIETKTANAINRKFNMLKNDYLGSEFKNSVNLNRSKTRLV